MNNFRKILYVSLGTGDDTEGLKQALSLTRNNNAELKILLVTPSFPDKMKDHQTKIEDLMLQQVQNNAAGVMAALGITPANLKISYALESGSVPAVRIIRHVMQNGFDLVIKDADIQKNDRGFKALDMDLLRKCPVPVWLCRPITQSRDAINVAVAIDPESTDKNAENLSINLLHLARALSNTCNGTLDIISCWDFPYEQALRDSALMATAEDSIQAHIAARKTEHESALHDIVARSGIEMPYKISHIRGIPDDAIPAKIESDKIDILVMGTVARTGIAGFIMGNTAENIVQKITCSLLATKPGGFTSPVKL